jgi:hypothetical protein
MADTEAEGAKPKRSARAAARAASGETPGKPKPASRAIARALWQHDFETANPDATAEQRKEGWTKARAQYVKLGKQVQKRLERAGFVITAAPGATVAADDDED